MNKCPNNLYRTTTLFLQCLLLVIICAAGRVFAGKVTVKLIGGTVYKGYIVSYTDPTVVLETNPFDKTLITIRYRTISEIRGGGLSRLGPVDQSDVQNFLPSPKPARV